MILPNKLNIAVAGIFYFKIDIFPLYTAILLKAQILNVYMGIPVL